MPDPIAPEFFKFFLVSQSEHRMRIPDSCGVHIKDQGTKTVNLLGPSGDTWRVGLSKDKVDSDALYFKDGWLTFVKDHQLTDEELLIFQCLKHTTYKVEVFDLSGCPKQSAFTAKSTQSKAASTSGHRHSAQGLEFRMVINDSHRAHMNIPKSYLSESKTLSKRSSVTLRDPSGKLWPVKIRFKVRPCPEFTLHDGWHKFFTDNKLKVGDICIIRPLTLDSEESDDLLIDVRKLGL